MSTFDFQETTVTGPMQEQEDRKVALRQKMEADMAMMKDFEERITQGIRSSLESTTAELAGQKQQMRDLEGAVAMMATTTRTSTAAAPAQQQHSTAAGSGQSSAVGRIPNGPANSRGLLIQKSHHRQMTGP